MRVIVTGSSGRVGGRVVRELSAQGHEVIGLDARSSPGITAHQVKLEDSEAVRRAVHGATAVIHLGALMSWKDAEAARIFQANVLGSFHLFEAAAAAGVRRLIFASSGEVYPERSPAYLPVDEHHLTRPGSYYGMTKLLGEEMAWFYERKFKIPTVVLRFEHTQDAAELLDPDSFFSGPRFFLRARIRRDREFGNSSSLAILEPLDDGSEKLLLSRDVEGCPYRMPICDTRDLASAIGLALDNSRAVGETIGIGPDEATPFDEAIATISELTGLPFVEARLPGPAVNYSSSNAKARELLGFRPKWTFRRMVEEAAVRYRQEGT